MIIRGILRALLAAAFMMALAGPGRAEDTGGVVKLAWDNYNAGEYPLAYSGFSKLHKSDPANADIALGLAFSAMKLGKTDEAVKLAERFSGARRDFRQILQSAYFETANSAFEKKDWGKAETYFKKLIAAGGGHGANELLAWSLYNQAKYAEALPIFNSVFEKTKDPKIAEIIRIISERELTDKERRAWELYNSGKGLEALPIFKDIFEKTKNPKFAEMIRVITPLHEDLSLSEEGRAWELYNKGGFKEALPLFKSIYAKTPSPSIAEIIILIYGELGMENEGAEFIETVIKAAGKEGDKTRANFLFKKNCPVTAAQTYGGSDVCYYNAHTPEAKATLGYRSKTGDAGTSRLNETSATLSFTYPFYKGNILKFELTPKKLSSGSSTAQPFAGSYFRGAQKNELITSADVVEPRVSYEREGNIRHSLLLGSTPIGGEISPALIFMAVAEKKDHRFEAHRLPVDESILSYTGLKDPYGNSSWGRVVKTGFEAQYVLHPKHFYWASFKAGYDSYEGLNVERNDSYAFNAATGRTTPFESADLTAGVFATFKRFSKNLNAYTFGNGGYFSPQKFLAAGPFIRYQIRPCKGYWVDAQAAVSYLKYKTSNSKQYPLETTGDASTKEYDGDSFSGFGYSAKMDGLKALTGKWSAGWSAGINKSADYTEWKAGATLKYSFEPRSTVQMYLQ